MNNQKTKKVLFSLLLIPVAVVILFPLFETLLFSVKDYSPLKGLSGSPFVGMKHYTEFLKSPYVAKILCNSIVISLVALAVGLLYVYFSTVAVTYAKSRILRFLLTFIFCLPAFVPGILIANMLLPVVKTATGSGDADVLRFFVGVIDALRLSAFVIFAASFSEGKPWREGVKYTLVFAAIRLITIFTTDTGMISLLYNPMLYEKMDTLNTYVMRQGMGNGAFSVTAATDIIRVMCQMLPAVSACVLLVFAYKRKSEHVHKINPEGFVATLAAIIPLAMFVMLIISGASLFQEGVNTIIVPGYINEIIIAFMSALLAAAIAFGIAMLCKNANDIVSMVFLTVIILANGFLTTAYLYVREMGLANTILGCVLMNLGIVPILSIVFTFITKNISGIRKNIALLISGFAFSFAWFWGEILTPMVILNNHEIFPLSLIIREVILINSSLDAPVKPQLFSSLLYILIPLFVCGAGILAGQIFMKSDSNQENKEKSTVG